MPFRKKCDCKLSLSPKSRKLIVHLAQKGMESPLWSQFELVRSKKVERSVKKGNGHWTGPDSKIPSTFSSFRPLSLPQNSWAQWMGGPSICRGALFTSIVLELGLGSSLPYSERGRVPPLILSSPFLCRTQNRRESLAAIIQRNKISCLVAKATVLL